MNETKTNETKTATKFDRVEITHAKTKTRESKTGKLTRTNSAFLFRVRPVGGAWELITGAIDAGHLPASAEVFSGTFAKNVARAILPEVFKTCGLSVPKSVAESAEDAKTKIEEAETKRETKRRETWEAGRTAYLKNAKAKAGARFDKLEEEFGAE